MPTTTKRRKAGKATTPAKGARPAKPGKAARVRLRVIKHPPAKATVTPKSKPKAKGIASPEQLDFTLEPDEADAEPGEPSGRRSYLTPEQRDLLVDALAKGFTPTEIASRVEGISAWQARSFRRNHLGMSDEQVAQARYDTWRRLIEQGYSIEAIAKIYVVKPTSIRVMMTRIFGQSTQDIVRTAQKAKDERLLRKLRAKNPFRW